MPKTLRRRLATAGVALALPTMTFHGASAASEVATCDEQEATIVGTEGDDTIVGTSGRDIIAALGGTDHIYGGRGDDLICGGDGAETLAWGEGGADVIIMTTPGTVDGGFGADAVLAADAPRESVTVAFGEARAGVRVNLGRSTSRGQGNDFIVGVENVLGTSFDDRITGNDYRNYLRGNEGDDRLTGRAGDDHLVSVDGLDTLVGDTGDDRLFGGEGADSYHGGPGDDRLFDSGDDSGDDTLVGGSGNDDLDGGLGLDFGDGGSNRAAGDTCSPTVETQVNCEH